VCDVLTAAIKKPRSGFSGGQNVPEKNRTKGRSADCGFSQAEPPQGVSAYKPVRRSKPPVPSFFFYQFLLIIIFIPTFSLFRLFYSINYLLFSYTQPPENNVLLISNHAGLPGKTLLG
jgi:hypothetical protein